MARPRKTIDGKKVVQVSVSDNSGIPDCYMASARAISMRVTLSCAWTSSAFLPDGAPEKLKRVI